MTPLEPPSFDATDVFGASTVDAVAAARRAELDRWVGVLRTARDRRSLAELALAEQAAERPDAMLAVVEAMLVRAEDTANRSIALARESAAATVAAALDQAVAELRAMGQDPALVLRATGTSSSASGQLGPRPTAEDLWNRVAIGEELAPSLVAVSLEPAPVAPVVDDLHVEGPADAAGTEAGEPLQGPPAGPVGHEPAAHREAAPPAPGEGSLEPTVDPVGEVYDMFWQEVPGQGRVRDRLLRRSAKEGS